MTKRPVLIQASLVIAGWAARAYMVMENRAWLTESFGTTLDGRVFQTARGGILQDSGYNEVWDQARREALTPPGTGHRSAAARMTCGTRRCRCG